MSYLSASENVGFSGIPPNISDATCATQFKMAVEGAPAVCGEINSYINDSSGDDHTFINDNYFHTKFKIDPNELYTFHDSDVIASEITVSHTEDNFIFADAGDTKKICLDSPSQDAAMTATLTNGNIKDTEISNGHYTPVTKTIANKDVKTSNTKLQKVAKSHIQTKEISRTNPNNIIKQSSVIHPNCLTVNTSVSVAPSIGTKTSINSVSCNPLESPVPKVAGSVTFLDVFKREQGLVESEVTIKIEREDDSTVPTAKAVPSQTPRKVSSGKPSSSRRRGRGPTMHEALQRIARAVPVRNRPWSAPGDELFQCGPLDGSARPPRPLDSSDDDDLMPNFGERIGCVSELSAVSRGARLAMRRAALRRQLAQAAGALRLAADHRRQAIRTHVIKKQLSSAGVSRLPTPAVNELLASRGLPSLLSCTERRQLRTSGWSGGDSVARSRCAHDACAAAALPAADHCLQHVTKSQGQRLFLSCAAVFAGGGRCSQPLLPLGGQTPLCAEHAWKRDNYDKISRDVRPKKMQVRKRARPAAPREPRRDKRRRPAPARAAAHHATAAGADHKLSELNVCSNSSAYDSSEDAGTGGLGEPQYTVAAANELEVEQVPADDDLLDSAVLGQIPDEAFTEFFNQAEGGATFAESSELARALEAVLDERALDSLADSLPAHAHPPRSKMQVSSVGVEMSSGVSS